MARAFEPEFENLQDQMPPVTEKQDDPCEECNGSGRVLEFFGYDPDVAECPACDGRGTR